MASILVAHLFDGFRFRRGPWTIHFDHGVIQSVDRNVNPDTPDAPRDTTVLPGLDRLSRPFGNGRNSGVS